MSHLSYKTLFIILVFLLIPIVLLLRINQKGKIVEAGWWNDSWNYRQAINISSHTVGETNVYIIAAMTIGSTAKVQTDAGDFRFTDQNSNLLSYYIISGAGTTALTFHIQFSSFPSGPQTIYAYYGNPSSTNGFSSSDFSLEASNYTIGSYATEETGGGPVAYWKFDEGVGTTTYDSSSNRLNARLIGSTLPVWTSEDQCVSGKCLNYPGTSYLSVTDNPVINFGTNSFTISTWSKVKNATSYHSFLGKCGQDNTCPGYEFFINGSTIYFRMTWTGGPQYGVSASITYDIRDDKWHHLVAVVNRTNSRIYLYGDGKLLNGSGTDISSVGNIDNSSAFTMGLSGAGYWKGYLDDVKIYPYARTATQIKADYASGLAGMGAAEGANVNMGSSSQKSLSDGLVGYWKFDEGVGTTSTDFSGNSNTITFATGSSAPTWATGKYGIGLSFNGGSNYTQNSSVSNFPSSAITTAFWIKTTDSGDGIISYATSANDNQFLLYRSDTIDIYLNGYIADTPTAVNDGVWHHLIVTWQSSNGETKVYKDSLLVFTTTLATGTTIAPSGCLIFGQDQDSVCGGFQSGQAFNGSLDEIRIYDRVLNQTEITALYNFAPPPVAYWDFEEGTGTTAFDTSGNSNNGLLGTGTSAPLWTNGKIGKALSFDGSNDYISVGSTLSNINTISFWVNSTTTSQYFLDLDAGTHYISASSGVISAVGFTTPLIYINGIGTSSGLTANVWNYITVTTTTAFNATNITLGKSSTNFFNGLIDDIKIYNYIRSPGQIQSDMSAGKSNQVLGWYKFDEGYGTTTFDSSGHQNLGTSGITWTNTGKINKAIDFGSSVAAAKVYYNDITGSIFDLTNDFSFGAWVYRTGTPASQARIISKGDKYLLFTTNNDIPSCYMSDLSTQTLAATSALPLNQWTHVLCTFKDNVRKLYINGILNTQDTRTGTITTDNLDLVIGNYDTASDNYRFRGLIDEAKIYNYALTPDEVKTDYNGGFTAKAGQSVQTIGATTTSLTYCIPGDASTCSAPIAEWNFEQGSGTTAFDTSGNSNHGVFGAGTSAPTWVNGKFGKALSFDGSNDYASVGSTLSNINTISFWVKPTTTSQYFLDLDGGTHYISASSGVISAVGFTTPLIYINGIGSSSSLTANVWNYITVTTSTAFNATNPTLGKSTTNFLNGSLDDVKIYNYVRTPAQVAYDYNRGAPIAWWKMDECQGSTIFDSSGLGNTGTISIGASGTQNTLGTCTVGTSAAWTAGSSGKINSSLNFDGNDDYVDLGTNSTPRITTDVSISAWIKLINDYTSIQTILSNVALSGSGCNYHFEFGRTDNKLTWIQNGNSVDATSTNSISDNNWHFVVATRTGSTGNWTVKFYIDGLLDSTTNNISVNPGSSPGSLSIGRAGSYNGSYFKGQIDDVRIYNYPLTSAQVQTLYNGGSVNFR